MPTLQAMVAYVDCTDCSSHPTPHSYQTGAAPPLPRALHLQAIAQGTPARPSRSCPTLCGRHRSISLRTADHSDDMTGEMIMKQTGVQGRTCPSTELDKSAQQAALADTLYSIGCGCQWYG